MVACVVGICVFGHVTLWTQMLNANFVVRDIVDVDIFLLT